MFSKVCILALLFAIAYSQSINTIEGTWTDSRYGGKLYLCTDDSFGVWGTYSEAGVYWGYLDESRNIAEGRWCVIFIFSNIYIHKIIIFFFLILFFFFFFFFLKYLI